MTQVFGPGPGSQPLEFPPLQAPTVKRDNTFVSPEYLGLPPQNELSFSDELLGSRPFDSANFFPVGELVSQAASAGDVARFTQKIQGMDGNLATPEEAREIAAAVLEASAEFDLPPELLLATLGHESQFDPQANKGNGKGLGQVTQPARAELQRISRGGPDGYRARVSDETLESLRSDDFRELLGTVNSSNRNTRNGALLSVDPNVRVSAAYLRLMLDVNRGNVREALSEYNGAGGAIQRAYPGHVADTYQALWGGSMPSSVN